MTKFRKERKEKNNTDEITLVSVVYKNALQRFDERKQHSLKVDSFKIMRNNHKQLIYAKQIKHLAEKKRKHLSFTRKYCVL